MKTAQIFLSTVLAGVATAAPSKTVNRRSQTGCGQYQSVTVSPYVVQNNLWGEGSGSGSQCYTVNGVSDNSIAWSSKWQWSGNNNAVKSYSNVYNGISNRQLSQISSLPTTWQWSYSGSNVEADVSYDMFTASSPSGAHEYEIMIWLAALGGANPISSSYNSAGQPVPLVSGLSFAGKKWNLYSGPNGDTTVYSFVATSAINSFSGDIMDFINYLIHRGMPNSQYLLGVQAGTEAFTGSGTFTTTKYQVTV